MMSDFAVLDMKILLAASKNRRYRESIVKYSRALICFLQDHKLTTRELLQPGETPCEDFLLMKSDLTEDGLKLIKSTLSKRTAKIEDGGSTDDLSILEDGLQKIRG